MCSRKCHQTSNCSMHTVIRNWLNLVCTCTCTMTLHPTKRYAQNIISASKWSLLGMLYSNKVLCQSNRISSQHDTHKNDAEAHICYGFIFGFFTPPMKSHGNVSVCVCVSWHVAKTLKKNPFDSAHSAIHNYIFVIWLHFPNAIRIYAKLNAVLTKVGYTFIHDAKIRRKKSTERSFNQHMYVAQVFQKDSRTHLKSCSKL